MVASETNLSKFIAGVMSGTSMDGVDLSIVEITPNRDLLKVHHFSTTPYDKDIITRLKKINDLKVQDIAELNTLIGSFIGRRIKEVMKEFPRLDLVSSHGQTIYHFSRRIGALRTTLQIGCGDEIAVITGVPVISDCRMKDIALGGEGAPLVCYLDQFLLRNFSNNSPKAVLNIGGIANLTYLDFSSTETDSKIIGFDTGPGNAPLDRLAAYISGESLSFDNKGEGALLGEIEHEVIERLLKEDKYLFLSPPKTSGFEVYGDLFVETLINNIKRENLLASATYLVGRSIEFSVRTHLPKKPETLFLCGGGVHNFTLVGHLRRLLPEIKIAFYDELGVAAKAREAVCWALFGNDYLQKISTNIPAVTGALRSGVMGKLSLPF